MNNFLLSRAIGSVSQSSFARAQNDRLIHAFQHASNVNFTFRDAGTPAPVETDEDDLKTRDVAHPAGVNSITIDRFEGRYLLSGGADASIAIWDLEDATSEEDDAVLHHPIGRVNKDTSSHGAGITQLSFYPFDSLAFLSSSYDHSLRLYSSESLTCSASFDLASVVYSHAMSPIASHLLVACATQHPAVRLVDLKSGASTHSLAGHSGAVMSVAWHPKQEHILLSGASDGSIRLWDIRRSASSLGVLDMDDTAGTIGLLDSNPQRGHQRGKAHNGFVNGVLWTEEGDNIITSGHDQVVRVWDGSTGGNTLVNFGPQLRNAHSSTLLPLVSPTRLTGKSKEILIYPNPRELLVFELHTGKLLSRLRTPAYATLHTSVAAGKGTRNVLNRTTSLSWRAHDAEMYSAHTDGSIRCWRPRTWEDALVDGEDEEEGDYAELEKKRKRDELDDIVNGLTKKKVTFN